MTTLKDKIKNIGVRLPIAESNAEKTAPVNSTTFKEGTYENIEIINDPVNIYDIPPTERDVDKIDTLSDNIEYAQQNESTHKPVPATRNLSSSPITNVDTVNLEKRVESLEKKVDHLSLQNNNSESFDKYFFAMDIWANVAKSNTIPEDVKKEIKKILVSTAAE